MIASFTTGQITRADVESVIAHQLPAQRERIAQPGGVAKLVDELIRYDLLVQEARARGYAQNVVVREATARKASDLMIAQRLSVDPSSITADELQRAFQQHRREFTRPHMRRATHILCATKAEADTLIANTKHVSREQFAQLAREHSIDASTRSQGGELGYFDEHGESDPGHAARPPQLTAATFKLKHVGDVTPHPIEVPGGFSVLMLTGEIPAFSVPKEQSDERLLEELVNQHANERLDALVSELRAQLKPVVHAELVDLIVMPEATPLGIPEGFPAAPPDPREPPKTVIPDKY